MPLSQRVGGRRGRTTTSRGLRRRHSAPLLQHDRVDTPFRLHLAVGDVGHTLIIGPTGAGKSTLLGMLALGWLKYPGAQVIVFDKDRSARAATLAVGGACYEPGNETRARRLPAARRHRPAGRAHLGHAVRPRPCSPPRASRSTTGRKTRHRRDAREPRAPPPREQRTLTLLATQLGSRQRALREALRPYTLEGNFGQIFDADRDDVRTGAAGR